MDIRAKGTPDYETISRIYNCADPRGAINASIHASLSEYGVDKIQKTELFVLNGARQLRVFASDDFDKSQLNVLSEDSSHINSYDPEIGGKLFTVPLRKVRPELLEQAAVIDNLLAAGIEFKSCAFRTEEDGKKYYLLQVDSRYSRNNLAKVNLPVEQLHRRNMGENGSVLIIPHEIAVSCGLTQMDNGGIAKDYLNNAEINSATIGKHDKDGRQLVSVYIGDQTRAREIAQELNGRGISTGKVRNEHYEYTLTFSQETWARMKGRYRDDPKPYVAPQASVRHNARDCRMNFKPGNCMF